LEFRWTEQLAGQESRVEAVEVGGLRGRDLQHRLHQRPAYRLKITNGVAATMIMMPMPIRIRPARWRFSRATESDSSANTAPIFRPEPCNDSASESTAHRRRRLADGRQNVH
jgi:hypothetical protein